MLQYWRIYRYTREYYIECRCPHYSPPSGLPGATTDLEGRPRRGATAGVKIADPRWGFKRSTLTDSCLAPMSKMKYLGKRVMTA